MRLALERTAAKAIVRVAREPRRKLAADDRLIGPSIASFAAGLRPLALADAIRDVRENVRYCQVCFNLAEGMHCSVCLDPKRDRTQLCVVEQPRDVMAVAT